MDHRGGDANSAREVLTSAMYRRFLPRMKLPDSVNILDLGVGNGGFPLLLQADSLRLGKVVCLEFNPKTFFRLQFNLHRNLDADVTVQNAALCGESKMLEIAIGDGGVSDNIFEKNVGPNAVVHKIRGLSLDEIIETHFGNEAIDICKMDVEGAEFEVFAGGAYSRLTQCRYLIMEIHESKDRPAEKIINALEQMGFERQSSDTESDPWVHFFC